jgi:type II secretory pathway pseudopilin PulG
MLHAVKATMKMELKAKPTNAMTLFEALVVIALIVMLAAVLLPALAAGKTKSLRIACVNNLKEISLASKIWEGDNGDKLPMQVFATNDVMMKAIASGNSWQLWQTMSNELMTPKILHCPVDQQTAYATAFAQGFSDTNISYLLNLDASDTYPQMILNGDDNIAVNGTRAVPGILKMSTNSPVTWTQERHHNAGNIGLADGSVAQVSGTGLRATLIDSGTNSVRFVIP